MAVPAHPLSSVCVLHTIRAQALLFGTVVLLAGCGDSDVNTNRNSTAPDVGTLDTSEPPPGPSIREIFTDLNDVRCSRAVECCSPSELNLKLGISSTVEGCQEQSESLLGDVGLLLINRSIEADRIALRPEFAELCEESLRQQICQDWTPAEPRGLDLPGCREFVIPLVELGGTCAQDIECLEGYCAFEPDAEEGACTAFLQDGQGCSEGRCREPEFFCNEDNICEQKKRKGFSCRNDVDCITNICGRVGERQECVDPPPVCTGEFVTADDL